MRVPALACRPRSPEIHRADAAAAPDGVEVRPLVGLREDTAVGYRRDVEGAWRFTLTDVSPDHDGKRNHRRRNITLLRTISSAGRPQNWSHSIRIGGKPAGAPTVGRRGGCASTPGPARSVLHAPCH